MICDNWDPLWEYVYQGVCMSLCAMICLRPGMSQICGYVDIYKAQNKDIQTLCLSSELFKKNWLAIWHACKKACMLYDMHAKN